MQATETSSGSAQGVAGEPRRAHPLLWVPSLYFAMGTPMITVSVVAAILYKNMGVSNADIAFHTGFMYLPWTLKPLWAPLVEMFRTKRWFVLVMELAMMVTLGCVALALPLPSYMPVTLAFFWITGFASATQDIAADGVYIGSTSAREQAVYVGVQGIFWNIGRIVASGLLVSFTGLLHARGMSWPQAWMIVFGVLAAVMGLSAVWHWRVLPAGGKTADAPASAREAAQTFGRAFSTFFAKPRIGMMIAVVLSYRMGEGLIEKIGPLFMIEARAQGGLGLSNVNLGAINGTYGTIGFIVGALLGGFFAARRGLRQSLLLLALALNVPHLTYFFLATELPHDLGAITALVTLEKFGYGFGSVGHMLYMMQQVAPGPFKTAHYAFATGLMGLSMMLTGMVSGVLQESVGYQTFFAIALAFSVPPILIAWRAPFPVDDSGSRTLKAAGRA